MNNLYILTDIQYLNFTVYLLDSNNNRIKSFSRVNCSQTEAGNFLKNIHLNYSNNTDIEYIRNMQFTQI